MNGAATNLSAVKLALMAQEARAQAQAFINADPIAIVGMACRAPGGVDTPDALWRLVRGSIDATREVPPERWDGARWFDADPSAPGKITTNRAGFLETIGAFDPNYFGILPREAELMDPQQRLALETAIEAVDDAGIPHECLKGSRTGVFIASYHDDYARLVYEDVDAIDLRTLTGTLQSIVSNRISHFLDLRGPSFTLDSACSASLIAVHLACQSLRFGESDFALAGGVSVILMPELMVAMSKVGFMAPDGRCKAFDARADGFGRGEGCGIVALKRLSDAIASGDRVIALIRGSAVNQDGRSTVLTAPNGVAQENLIREALSNAAVAPERVVYVEAHGTGTALGDPIEVDALGAALAAPGAGPCYLGSIKANIGHLEAAAGVIGLIKAALVLRHGEIPPQPHFDKPNPHLQLDGTRLKIAVSPQALPASPVCAGVSSFGVGGTNAHVLLEQAPDLGWPAGDAAPGKDAPWVLPLSAKTANGLRALGEQWLDLLHNPAAPALADLCWTASQRRTHYPTRVAVVARTHAETAARLRSALTDLVERSHEARPKIGFVYSGQGPQWWGMGRELFAREPVFAAALEASDEAIRATAGWSVIEEMQRDASTSRLGETEIAQPSLFALQTALTALWRSWGVCPDAVVGHSVGEIAAMQAADALTLEELARVVTLRGRIMQAATGGGRMASASIAEFEARALVEVFDGRLNVAAINAPRSVVLSGEYAALEAALARLGERGVEARKLPVDYAFHSAQMTLLAKRFEMELGRLHWRSPQIAIYSTLTGARVPQSGFVAADVARAIRAPVRFADAIKAMGQDSVDAFVEIGPHPVLAAAIAETLDARPPRVLTASLRRGRDEGETIREACAQLYAAGVDPDWSAVQPGEGAVVSLPAYPWQRRRCWVRNAPKGPLKTRTKWLGEPNAVAARDEWLFNLEPGAAEWLADHVIFGRPIVPAAAMMQAMAEAARRAFGRESALSAFEIKAPLPAPAEGIETRWQILISEDATGARRVSLHVGERDNAQGAFNWWAVADAVVGNAPQTPRLEVSAGIQAEIGEAYARFEALGASFGPSFRVLSDVSLGEGAACAWAELTQTTDDLHPALIDAGNQLVGILDGPHALRLPMAVDHFWIASPMPQRVRVKAKLTARSERTVGADVVFESADGVAVGTLIGLHLAIATADAFKSAAADVYAVNWERVELGAEAGHRRWAILGDGRAELGLKADANVIEIRALNALPAGASLLVAAKRGFDATALAALIKAIPDTSSRTLAIVTRGAVSTKPLERADADSSALWGLASVAAVERPDLSLRLLDLDPSEAANGAAVAEYLSRSAEARLAWREGVYLAPRLRKSSVHRIEGPHQLTLQGVGLDAIALRPLTPQEPHFGEVRLRVTAAGINFRDTLIALGMYEGAPAPLGAECAGVVEAVGPGVSGFVPGDRVFGLAPACHATHAIARADMIAKTPSALSDAEAASLPVAFVTADTGLNLLAGMKPGDRVLIHAATGGVGFAAVALAQRAGAEVHATAGSDAKRDVLRRLGVVHVYDSRSTAFAEQILAATGGAGVRIALNSLTGDFVGATLRTLARGGVLLEMGKREIWSPEEVAAVRPDVAYHVFDSGERAYADASIWGRFVADMLPAIVSGDITRPPVQRWTLARAGDAFRWMAQARHVGKLVLLPSGRVAPMKGARYLVTGGLGGLGLFAAEWLAERGARHLLLVGRSAPGDGAAQRIKALRAKGIEVHVACTDVADADAMRALIAEPGAPPLRGIIHAAGVAPDAPLHASTVSQIAAARHGKVEGAKVLRFLTRDLDLDFFILYSAAAVALGAPGQAAYAAANAELDALAAQWRSEGVRAFSVAWGAWAGAGMFASMAERAQAAWNSRGLSAFGPSQAFSALGRLMDQDLAYGLIANINWARFFANAPAGLALEPFEAFAPKTAPAFKTEIELSERAKLKALPQAARRQALELLIAERVRELMGLPVGQVIETETPLRSAGLDSLMAVELRNGLARLGGAPLPVTLVFDHPTIAAIAEKLMAAWDLGAPAKAARDDDLAALSEAEAEALLEAELQELAAERRIERRLN